MKKKLLIIGISIAMFPVQVFEDYNKTLKDKVEYLTPDSSKTVSTTPNPPPRVL